MSAVESSDGRYLPMARFPIGHQVLDSFERFRPVDLFRSRSGAEYAARMLNSGFAVINPHATIGCRVEVRFPEGIGWD